MEDNAPSIRLELESRLGFEACVPSRMQPRTPVPSPVPDDSEIHGTGDNAQPTLLDREMSDMSDDNEEIAESWEMCIPTYINEMMRAEAPPSSLACGTCGIAHSTASAISLFRCSECQVSSECGPCVVNRHKLLPLHPVQEWTGSHWNPTTLITLGLVHQLGHGDDICHSPASETREMKIIDLTGVTNVKIRICACNRMGKYSFAQQLLRNHWYPDTASKPISCATFRLLDTLQMLTMVCNINAADFIAGLCRMQDPSAALVKSEQLFDPDRLQRMLREYSIITQLNQSGAYLNLSDENIPGEAYAIQCWACPQEGKNITKLKGRRDRSQSKFLRQLQVEIKSDSDLSLRKESDYEASLLPNGPYLVDMPSSESVRPETFGLIGAACARHGLIRPKGLGELRAKENFRQMDHIFCSSVQGTSLPNITVSHDRGCDWRARFALRMRKIPDSLRLNPTTSVAFWTPHWEGMSLYDCGHPSFHNSGRDWVHGEALRDFYTGLKHDWKVTKHMSHGARREWINDRAVYHNFNGNLGIGNALLEEIQSALRSYHEAAIQFRAIDRPLNPATRKEWMKHVDNWRASLASEDPYVPSIGPNIPSNFKQLKDSVRQMIREFHHNLSPNEPVDTRPTFFDCLLMGLELEETQLELAVQSSKARSEDPTRKEGIDFGLKLYHFRLWQNLFMPASTMKRVFGAEMGDYGLGLKPQDMKLWLPSECDSSERPPGLGKMELNLREAQCVDALIALATALRTARWVATLPMDSDKKPYINDFDLQVRVDTCLAKYRRARSALIALGGDASVFPNVEDIDLKRYADTFDSATFASNLAHVINDRKQWMGPNADVVQDYVRVEWSRSLARRTRYSEEVTLLKEEMKRVLHFLDWQAGWWEAQATEIVDRSTEEFSLVEEGDIDLGKLSYAKRQIGFLHSVSGKFRSIWAPYI